MCPKTNKSHIFPRTEYEGSDKKGKHDCQTFSYRFYYEVKQNTLKTTSTICSTKRKIIIKSMSIYRPTGAKKKKTRLLRSKNKDKKERIRGLNFHVINGYMQWEATPSVPGKIIIFISEQWHWQTSARQNLDGLSSLVTTAKLFSVQVKDKAKIFWHQAD